MHLSDVAIVGGGIAGLSCARALKQGGLSVEVFDKGRGVGGRTCTRRLSAERFDHGAQFFTLRDERFARLAAELEASRYIARWEARFGQAEADGVIRPHQPDTRWVGTPTMSIVAKALAAQLRVKVGQRVERIERRGGRWLLRSPDGVVLGRFPRVVVALPAPQAAQLLVGTTLYPEMKRVKMAPCWAVMVSFASPLPLSFDAIRWAQGPLAWIARESSKPGRLPGNRWVLHASAAFSREHLEEAPESMIERLLAALQALAGPLPEVLVAQAHRWRYAQVEQALGRDMLYDEHSDIGACGDWCRGGRVEAAAVSGLVMADNLLSSRRMRPAS